MDCGCWQKKFSRMKDSLVYLLHEGLYTDCSFIVGSSDKRMIKAHKLVLIQVSDVFEDIFYGKVMTQSEGIKVPDIEPEIFQLFLRIIYSEELVLNTVNEGIKLHYVACKYNVGWIIDHCINYILKQTNQQNAVQVFEFLMDIGWKGKVDHCKKKFMPNNSTLSSQLCLEPYGYKEISDDLAEERQLRCKEYNAGKRQLVLEQSYPEEKQLSLKQSYPKEKHRALEQSFPEEKHCALEQSNPEEKQLFLEQSYPVEKQLALKMSYPERRIVSISLEGSETITDNKTLPLAYLNKRERDSFEGRVIKDYSGEPHLSGVSFEDRRRMVYSGELSVNDLMEIAEKDDVALLECLKRNGVNLITADKDGWSALHRAVGKGAVNTVNWLLTNVPEIEIDCATTKGNGYRPGGSTSLHLASWDGSCELVKILLAHGANRNVVDHKGKTPIKRAKARGHFRVVELLQS